MSNTQTATDDTGKRIDIRFVLIADGHSGKPKGKMTVGGIEFFYLLEAISERASRNIKEVFFDAVVSVRCDFCGSVGYGNAVFDKERQGIVMTLEHGVKAVLTIDQSQLAVFKKAASIE